MTLSGYYKDIEVLDKRLQNLEQKLDKAIKIMLKSLKEMQEYDRLRACEG